MSSEQYANLTEAEREQLKRIAAVFDDFAVRCKASGFKGVGKCAERTAMAVIGAIELGDRHERP